MQRPPPSVVAMASVVTSWTRTAQVWGDVADRAERLSSAAAPRTSIIVAKFAGRCSCGAKVAAGSRIAYGKSYDHAIVGCEACDFATFPGATPESLIVEARGYMALADNAIRMMARDGSVGRLLTRNTLCVEAARRAAGAR